jgi:hypothetical protein
MYVNGLKSHVYKAMATQEHSCTELLFMENIKVDLVSPRLLYLEMEEPIIVLGVQFS